VAHKVDWDQLMDRQKKMLSFFWQQDQQIRAISPQAAANHVKLWASTPVWDRGQEEIELYAWLMNHRNAERDGL
jgi:hypothetical protein